MYHIVLLLGLVKALEPSNCDCPVPDPIGDIEDCLVTLKFGIPFLFVIFFIFATICFCYKC